MSQTTGKLCRKLFISFILTALPLHAVVAEVKIRVGKFNDQQAVVDLMQIRLKGKEEYLRRHPETRKRFVKAIRAGKILKGMCPHEAHAAGGLFKYYFKSFDPKLGKQPFRMVVLVKQCKNPDASEFIMIFENSTQFGKQARFKAVIRNGRVVEIIRL